MHGFSAEPFPESSYVGSSKNLKDLETGSSVTHGMGRLGQDKPAFGWELEPFWPLLLSGGDSSHDYTEIGIASCTGATRYGSAGSLIGGEFVLA